MLLGREPDPVWCAQLMADLGADPRDKSETARRIVSRMLTLPETQLG
jgi:hypothetical protein